MGMFDWVHCEYPALPDKTVPDFLCQTKDLGNCMDHYIITAEGQLVLQEWDWEEVPPAEQNRYGFPLIRKVAGSERRIVQIWTGTLHFYGDSTTGQLYMISLTDPPDPQAPPPPPWYEFTATFVDGQLQQIRGTVT